MNYFHSIIDKAQKHGKSVYLSCGRLIIPWICSSHFCFHFQSNLGHHFRSVFEDAD